MDWFYIIVPQLPEESSGTTYSRLFGVNTGPLEHLLVKRHIMGPSWLKIDQAQISNTNVRCHHHRRDPGIDYISFDRKHGARSRLE